MSLTKNYHMSTGFSEPIVSEPPIFEIGNRFTYKSNIKSKSGTWEITSVEKSPIYECVRVLSNGKLSRSEALRNKRMFDVRVIKNSLETM
ncbi:hypothetical protein V1503_19085 [Bacillus sp. SCS-151]|uniref:hypothetical protein n=1 Tax=Nanhaiella sioensis TaxID=3115293 RepID=UPI003978E003